MFNKSRYKQYFSTKLKSMKFTLFFVSLFLTLNANSAIIYVDINATGSNNGTSWSNAYTDLQMALSLAFINDEIWVATGTYYPTNTANRDISFVMKNGVNVFGGFDGTETNINQRNIALNPTNLSGDIGQLGDNTDNSRKVVKVQNFTANFIMDGFRVMSGYDSGSSGKGSGMYMINNSGSDITVNNCTFYNNYSYHSGGALIVDETHVTFNNCEFLYNSSYNYGGGAIYAANVSHSDIYLFDSKFIGNNSRDGAAINFDGISLILNRCLISNNTSTSGDIISVSNSADTVYFNNSILAGNLLNDASGSLISIYSSSPAIHIANSTICHNKNNSGQTPYAEMIHRSNGTLNIYNSIVYGNTNSDQNLQIDPGNYVINSIVENGYPTGVNIMPTSPNFSNPGTLAMAPFDASSYDYSLVLNSPGINQGDNVYASQFLYDFELNNRIQQLNVDCGAIESPFSDTENPTAICQDQTISLDINGNASITSTMIDNGSFDNIGVVNYVLSNETFDCMNLGSNSVSLTVYDAAGNSDVCVSTVTVIDGMLPTVVGQNISVNLDSGGNATILASQIENGSFDNCGIQSFSISQSDFNCSNIGNNTVILTVEDINGNTNNAPFVVTINDITPPIAIAQDITVYLNNSGNATISASAVNNGSNDECSISSMTVSPTNVSCISLGTVSGTLNITDQGGNSTSDNFTILVYDTIRPTAIGMNIQVNLADANPYIITPADIDAGSFDNCNVNLSIDQNSFNSVGVYPVVLTATDDSGNIHSQTYQVEVIESHVGIIENGISQIAVSPNPFQSEIYVKLNSDEMYEFYLVNSLGQEIAVEQRITNKPGELMLDLSNLNAGVYYLSIIDEASNKVTHKLIKSVK